MSAPTVTAGAPLMALGFVTFGAKPTLVRRLEVAHAAGYRLYVFDNSPDLELVRDACRQLVTPRYLTCGRNAGLGVGLASVCAQAYYDGFAALLVFDQDTVFDRSTLDFISGFLAAKPKVGRTHSAVVFNAKRVGEATATDRFAHRDVLVAISSGSLFYLDNLRRIGWHNPTYFVDCVDYEFCLNSSNHRLLIGECSTTPGFDHETEQADHTRTVFGQRRRLRRYSWARVTDAVVASTRVLGTALVAGNGQFAFAISRLFAGYLWWQVVSRVLRLPAHR